MSITDLRYNFLAAELAGRIVAIFCIGVQSGSDQIGRGNQTVMAAADDDNRVKPFLIAYL